MSVWTSLLSWGLSAAKTEGQQLGMKAIADATSQLTKVIDQHAPDMAPVLAPAIQTVVQGAVAGIMTKTSK